MQRITVAEMEVADVAHYMGYEMMRTVEGYLLARRYGNDNEIIRVRTLKDVTEFLTH